jgi:hypothetical protein
MEDKDIMAELQEIVDKERVSVSRSQQTVCLKVLRYLTT